MSTRIRQATSRVLPDRVHAQLREHGHDADDGLAYARTMLLKGRYVAIEVPFDVPRVTVQVNRIGINVNQIARKCNEDDLVTVAELRQVRRELEKCYRQLDDAWKLMHDAKSIARNGGGRVDPPIPSDDAADTPSPEA